MLFLLIEIVITAIWKELICKVFLIEPEKCIEQEKQKYTNNLLLTLFCRKAAIAMMVL